MMNGSSAFAFHTPTLSNGCNFVPNQKQEKPKSCLPRAAAELPIGQQKSLLLQTTAALWDPCQMAPSPLFQISADLLLRSNLPSADHTPWPGVRAKGLQFATGVDRVWTCSLVSICVRERGDPYTG